MIELTNGPARLEIDPERGARITSFAVAGHELLLTPKDDPDGLHWGCFVMAPWAGRTRFGRFTFGGEPYELEINSGPHAIHGTVRDRPWTVTDASATAVRMACAFGPHWPFNGRAELHLALGDDRVDVELALHAADGPMPAIGGWHPWWRRRLASGATAELELRAGSMLARDADGIATDHRLAPPPPGPWDDCFTDLEGPPVLRWPGAVELTIDSDCAFVVVYDEPAEAICVEPQSAPPDALNHHPAVAQPGEPVVVHMSWVWTLSST